MHRSHVLLVEDNPVLADGVAWLLEEEGLEVDVVRQGRQTIGQIAHCRPDVLVLDISLGDIDGIVIAQAVRKTWPHLPIIFTSGRSDYRGLAEALADPRTSILQKPYTIADLCRTIERMTLQ